MVKKWDFLNFKVCPEVVLSPPLYAPIHSYGPNAPLAHQVSAYPHVGKRSADAKAHGFGYVPQCTTITQKVCSQVPVQTPTVVKVPSCSIEPRTECNDVTSQVPETECNDVTKKQCQKVPKEVRKTSKKVNLNRIGNIYKWRHANLGYCDPISPLSHSVTKNVLYSPFFTNSKVFHCK